MFFYRVLSLVAFLLAPGLYAQTEVSWVGALPELIQESSGLLLVGDRFVTHNDSGNSPELFVLDTTSLEVVRRVWVVNAENTDWEDLAQDASYIYIGDIGNNLGNRKDLKVLRISKEAFLRSDTVEAAVISFSYEDQTEFAGFQNSDWDAEALLAGPDSLWVLTKQWQGEGTVAYGFPKEPGDYRARRTAEYPAGGLITGASPIPGEKAFLLLGYSSQLQPFFLKVFSEYPVSGQAAQARKIRIDIPFAQAEGITVSTSGEVFLSTETFSNGLVSLPAGIFRYVPATGSEGVPGPEDLGGHGEPEVKGSGKLVLYQPRGTEKLQYRVSGKTTILARAIFDLAGRRIRFEEGTEALPREIDVSGLRNAVYYLTLYLPNQRLTKPFLRL